MRRIYVATGAVAVAGYFLLSDNWWQTGDLAYALSERLLHEPAPFPSLADALYLAGSS